MHSEVELHPLVDRDRVRVDGARVPTRSICLPTVLVDHHHRHVSHRKELQKSKTKSAGWIRPLFWVSSNACIVRTYGICKFWSYHLLDSTPPRGHVAIPLCDVWSPGPARAVQTAGGMRRSVSPFNRLKRAGFGAVGPSLWLSSLASSMKMNRPLDKKPKKYSRRNLFLGISTNIAAGPLGFRAELCIDQEGARIRCSIGIQRPIKLI